MVAVSPPAPTDGAVNDVDDTAAFVNDTPSAVTSDQAKVMIEPSESDEAVPSTVTDTPSLTGFGVIVNDATGATLTSLIVTSMVVVSVAPSLSVTRS